jgi:hypothetical protein
MCEPHVARTRAFSPTTPRRRAHGSGSSSSEQKLVADASPTFVTINIAPAPRQMLPQAAEVNSANNTQPIVST